METRSRTALMGRQHGLPVVVWRVKRLRSNAALPPCCWLLVVTEVVTYALGRLAWKCFGVSWHWPIYPRCPCYLMALPPRAFVAACGAS